MFWVLGGLIIAAIALVLGILAARPAGSAANREEYRLSDQEQNAINTPAIERFRATDENTPASSKGAAVHDLPVSPELEKLIFLLQRASTSGSTSEEMRSRLDEMRKAVHELPPTTAAATLVAFLESGEDASTGLAFHVGPEGVLAESPTLRTAALDFLGQTDPRMSAETARAILESTSSQDEFALALRNLAWANPNRANDAEIHRYFASMLDREEWLEMPSNGFLEAFDVAVDLSAFTEVASVLRLEDSGGNRVPGPVDRAAFVAADRIMLRNPDAVLAEFQKDPNFLNWAPFHRASLLSRLDVRQPNQKQQLQQYLLETNHAPGELAYFADIFLYGNFFVGPRLVTGAENVGGIAFMAELDRATLQEIESWRKTPDFSSRSTELDKISGRLQRFLNPEQ